MSGIWTMLSVMTLCMLGCAGAGYFLARRIGHSPAVVAAGLTAAAMLLFGRYMADSVWIARFVPAAILPVFGNWLPLLAGMLAGIGWAISPRPAWVKTATLGGLLVCAIYVPYRWLFDEQPLVQDAWAGDLCMQTTDATCGAAAAATLLRTAGISANEHEMAELCFTTWRGTPLHGVIYGLAKKTEGTPWQVRIAHMDQQTLAQLGRPALLRVGLEEDASPSSQYVRQWGWMPGVAHMVVATKPLAGGRFTIGDPASGWESWNQEALDILWQGIAIYLEPRSETGAQQPSPTQVLAVR